MKFNNENNIDLGPEWLNRYPDRSAATLEKVINKYITIKLVNGRTFIYVNGVRFIQCIRLVLNIPKSDVQLYDDVDSIDEAAKLYSKHVYQNRIVTGPMAAPVRGISHDITPDQEFWGHCSNIEAWIEHNYDTRILMSNISFPLLRELARAGDPVATKVFKEEIAHRLESGYPSVVQYLLNQGYIRNFTPSEFKTIIETTELIKGLSSDPKMVSQFLISCSSKFPTLLEDILIQILKLPERKNLILRSLSITENSRMHFIRRYSLLNSQYLFTLKSALEKLFREADEKLGEDVLDIIQEIERKLKEQGDTSPHLLGKRGFEAIQQMQMDEMVLEKFEAQKKLMEEIHKVQSKCSYCGKKIPKGQDICYWCGHKKDDDEGGFFPYPFIFKPPGGGGGSMKEIAHTVKIIAQT